MYKNCSTSQRTATVVISNWFTIGFARNYNRYPVFAPHFKKKGCWVLVGSDVGPYWNIQGITTAVVKPYYCTGTSTHSRFRIDDSTTLVLVLASTVQGTSKLRSTLLKVWYVYQVLVLVGGNYKYTLKVMLEELTTVFSMQCLCP